METHIAVTFLTFGVLFSMGILSQSKGKKEKIMLSLIIIFNLIGIIHKGKGAYSFNACGDFIPYFCNEELQNIFL